jgi:hypothetical protein
MLPLGGTIATISQRNERNVAGFPAPRPSALHHAGIVPLMSIIGSLVTFGPAN